MNRSPDIPCLTNDTTCKYYNSDTGCFEDDHHIYKRCEADTRQKKDFAGLWINRLKLCRRMHEELEAQLGWVEYPEPAEMQVQIDRYQGEYGTDRGA